MVRFGIFLHLFVVELRCLWLFYISSRIFVNRGTSTLFLYLRSTNVKQWCAAEECHASLRSLSSCISQGVSLAAWSTDRNFEKAELCIVFHGDNLLGYVNLSFVEILATIVLIICWKLVAYDVSSFTSGRYLVFTTQFLRKETLMQVMIKIAFLWMIALTLMIPFAILFQIPDNVIDKVDEDRYSLLAHMAVELAPNYATVFLVLWHLKDNSNPSVNVTYLLTSGIEFKRSWLDLFTQTNRACISNIEHAMIKAKYGDAEELSNMLIDADPRAIEQILNECSPNNKKMKIYDYIQVSNGR